MQHPHETIAGQLYDGVLAPQDWHQALAGMCAHLAAGVFHYFTLDTSGIRVPDSTSNLDSFGLHAGLMNEYETYHAGNDLRMAVTASMPVTQVMLDHEHISAREASRNSVYSDWLVPLGLRHTAGAVVRIEGSSRDVISFMRPRDARPYGAQDKAFIDHLMPHIARAARLRARMMQLRQQAELGLAALEGLPQALLVVDMHCHVHHANRAAERLLASPGPLQFGNGRLACVQSATNMRLLQLVSSACASPARAGALELRGASADPSRLMLTVLPLKASHALSEPWQRPLALVILGVPGVGPLLDQAVLSDMLGLSPSETRLLLLVASGKTVKDYAQLEGCSWHTARTHMKNLLRKTGCHRQVELVGLVRSMSLG